MQTFEDGNINRHYPPKGSFPSVKACTGCDDLKPVQVVAVYKGESKIKTVKFCKIGGLPPRSMDRCPIGAYRMIMR